MKWESIRGALVEGTFFQKADKRIKRFFVRFFNGYYLKKNLKRLDRITSRIVRRMVLRKEPIDGRKILLSTFDGEYDCNPKAIANEIIRQGLPWKLVWVAKKSGLAECEQYPQSMKIVEWEKYDFYSEASTAKVWITNSTYLTGLRLDKRPGQVLIQTWHGSLGLKRFETNQNKKWLKTGYRDGARTDYCISNSKFETDLFRNTFWKNAEILEVGHARNDILLAKDTPEIQELKRHIRESLEIPEGKKIAIYAPTFRDSKSLKPYSIDYAMVREALSKKFGGEWVIICRYHPQVLAAFRCKKKKMPSFPDFVINATDYKDMQELLLVADVGITDYSSWICDFVLTRRPGFLFATDVRSYYNERGFYFPLETTPFPLAENNRDLEKNILSFDEAAYLNRCEEFLQDKGCVDDGHAAERIVEKLKEIMEEAE